MATTLRSYIFITFLVCCVSFAILITSVSTTSWIEATLKSFAGDETDIVNYGLFVGTLTNKGMETPRQYAIYVTCIASKNVCAWSCRLTAEEREDEVLNLYTTANASFGCTAEQRTAKRMDTTLAKKRRWDVSRRSLIPLISSTASHLNATCNKSSPCTDANSHCSNGTCYCNSGYTATGDMSKCEIGRWNVDKTFVNLGLWGSTLGSLIITIVFASVAAIGAVVNTAANPVRTLVAIPGLYVWNGLAAFFAILTLVLWGGFFGAVLSKNVALRETITGEYAVNTSKLGFSYWLILGSALLHFVNIGILWFRKIMLSRIPDPPKVAPADDNDGTLFLY